MKCNLDLSHHNGLLIRHNTPLLDLTLRQEVPIPEVFDGCLLADIKGGEASRSMLLNEGKLTVREERGE